MSDTDVTMVNAEGEQVLVPADRAASAFNNGLGFPRNQPVSVIEPGSDMVSLVMPDQIQRAIDAGARVLPSGYSRELAAGQATRQDEGRFRRELQEEYGDPLNVGMTAIEGAADTLTMGQGARLVGAVGDFFSPGSGERFRGRRYGRSLANPTSRAVGSIGGLGGGLIGGARAVRGASRLGQTVQAATNPTAAALRGTAALERGLTARGVNLGRRLGVPDWVAGGAAGGAAGAAGGAVSQGVLNLSNELGQAELEGREADLSLANLSQGWETGAAIGGGLGGIVQGALRNPTVLRAVNDAVDRSWFRVAGRGDRSHRYRHNKRGEAALGSVSRELDIVGPETRSVDDMLTRADDAMVTAENGMFNALNQGSARGATLLAEDAAELAAIQLPPRPPGSASELVTNAHGQANGLYGRLRNAPLSVGGLWVIRRDMDGVINSLKGVRQPGAVSLRKNLEQTRRYLEDSVERAFGKASGNAAELQGLYVRNRQNWEAANAISSILQRQTPEMVQATNSLFRGGNIRRLLSRGAVGFALADGVGAMLLTGALYKLKAPQQLRVWKALAGENLLRFAGARRAARGVQNEIRESLRLDLTKPWKPNPRTMSTVASAISVGGYNSVANQVRSAMEAPALLRSRTEADASRLAGVSPEAAADVAATANRAVQSLERALPKGINELTLAAPYNDPDRLVSDAEKAAFMRFYRGANDPLSMLEDIRSGMLSYETVDAVREVHPIIYAEVRDAVREAIYQGGKEVPYEMLLQLGTLFPDIPTVGGLVPGMIQLLQAPFLARETGSVGGQMSQGPGPAPNTSPDLAKMQETRSQQIDNE